MTSGQSDAFYYCTTSAPRRIELMDRQESAIENSFKKWFDNHKKGFNLKLSANGLRGFPDRTILLPFGRCAFIEWKKPGGQPTKHQEWWIGRLRELGFHAEIFDNVEDAKKWIEGLIWKQ